MTNKEPGEDQARLTIRTKDGNTEVLMVRDNEWDCDTDELWVTMVDGKYTTTIHYPLARVLFWAIRRLINKGEM